MNYPERFSGLPAYAFPRLRALLDHHAPGGPVIQMTIGEPKHPFPAWVTDAIVEASAGFNDYPPNNGSAELRGAFTDWLARRYKVRRDPEQHVLPLNGTREGLYNAAMALCPERKHGRQPLVLSPNPFYQVYMVAALSVGAAPVFLPATRETGFLPDFSAVPRDTLDQTAIAYICSPANPQGAMATREYWVTLLELAERHDFRIFADECYCEIYRAAPPVGILEVADEIGADPERVLAFHSLSKRSNLPGLRSGFVVGGVESVNRMKALRAYAGAPPPSPLQAAAAKVWADEAHVVENRQLYAEKFELADHIFADLPDYHSPQAGFFLWLPVEDGEAAAMKLWRETGIRVLPGAYLAQDGDSGNPGARYIRVALVAGKDEMQRGLIGLRDCLYNKKN